MKFAEIWYLKRVSGNKHIHYKVLGIVFYFLIFVVFIVTHIIRFSIENSCRYETVSIEHYLYIKSHHFPILFDFGSNTEAF